MRSDQTVKEIRTLRDAPVSARERWIYVAGFNVGRSTVASPRVDREARDIAHLLERGARVAILSHQGRHHDGSAEHLGHVAARLTDLGVPTAYDADATHPVAEARSHTTPAGSAVLFGNTRHHAGEETNDAELAAAFARLGTKVAIGGFSKFHRAHASTVGLLERLPGVLADGVAQEIDRLMPWTGADPDSLGVLVLGGTKQEKTLVGLAELSHSYDLVVPGGAVLNLLLAALGHEIGHSELGVDDPSQKLRLLDAARQALTTCGSRLVLPETVVVAPGADRAGGRRQPVAQPVLPGWRVVDFLVPEQLLDRIARAPRVRALVAGTPCLHSEGHTRASTALLSALAAPHVRALLLGGDTTTELPWSGPTSTGGGSALSLLAHGSTVVLDALEANNRRQDGTEPCPSP